nr:transmembrane 9 superfamily member 1-like [Tanacetum cinerariifolium]
MGTSVVVSAVIIILVSSPVFASEYDHKYQSDDKVTLWLNNYDNSQDTYDFYSLLFCFQADHAHAEHKWGGLGEVSGGNELIDSQMDVKFQSIKCGKDYYLKRQPTHIFRSGSLVPKHGLVGELHSDRNTNSKHMLFTHMNITVQYNKDQIIHVNLTRENPKSLEVGKTLDMTYSVTWTETNVTFAWREWFSLCKTTGKICSILRAIDTVHHVDDYKGLLHSLSLPESRFRKALQMMQLQDAKRFRYESRLQSPMFLPETHGGDISQGAMFAYLLSSPVNIPTIEAHGDYGLQGLGMRKSVIYSRIDEREDGWMEVMLRKPLLQLENNIMSFTLDIWESKYGTLSASGMVL